LKFNKELEYWIENLSCILCLFICASYSILVIDDEVDQASVDTGSQDFNNDTPDELEEKINKLKEERLRLEKKTSLPNANSVTKMASKFTDLQWVLDRFYY
jgi:hypothetical protein